MHDLLSDPLIGVRTPQGERTISLPAVLAALSANTVQGYTGLRPHQADPWHVFLVQLTASILARNTAGTRPDRLPTDPAYWRDGLLDLADGMETAWHLVVDDVTKPAFLQHPWNSWKAEAADYGVKTERGKTTCEPKATTPDELDVLVTAKNHDVKMSRMGPQSPEAWVYALLLLQTTSGYLGKGHYGIVRMNGGFASRSIVAWAQTTNPSIRFTDDVRTLQSLRDPVCRNFKYQRRGIVLTWLTRWDGTTHQHQITRLEPWFIEAARRVRLRAQSGGYLYALAAISKARQIGPRTVDNGDVGDPWTAINVNKNERSALTLSGDGFTPERLTDLLFEQGFELTAMQKPKPGNEPGWFVASCLVRGQGTTEGFHRVEVPVPPKARMALINKQSRDRLAQLAQDLLLDARDVQSALDTALTVLAEGGPDKADFEREAVKRWLERTRADFSRRWKTPYFLTLWRGADESHEEVRRQWRRQLVAQAQALLADEAKMRLPLPSNRYWRAITQAHGALRGVLYNKGLLLPSAGSMAPAADIQETAA